MGRGKGEGEEDSWWGKMMVCRGEREGERVKRGGEGEGMRSRVDRGRAES